MKYRSNDELSRYLTKTVFEDPEHMPEAFREVIYIKYRQMMHGAIEMAFQAAIKDMLDIIDKQNK